MYLTAMNVDRSMKDPSQCTVISIQYTLQKSLLAIIIHPSPVSLVPMQYFIPHIYSIRETNEARRRE